MRSSLSKFLFFISSGNHQESINSNLTIISEISEEYEKLKKNYLQCGMNNDMLSYINKVALKIKFGNEVFFNRIRFK